MFSKNIFNDKVSLYSTLEDGDWNRFYDLLNSESDFSSEFNNQEKNPLVLAIYQYSNSHDIEKENYLHRVKMLICCGANVENQDVKNMLDLVISEDLNLMKPLENASKLIGQKSYNDIIKNVCREIREIPGKYKKKPNSRRQDSLDRLSELEKELSEYSNVYLDRASCKIIFKMAIQNNLATLNFHQKVISG